MGHSSTTAFEEPDDEGLAEQLRAAAEANAVANDVDLPMPQARRPPPTYTTSFTVIYILLLFSSYSSSSVNKFIDLEAEETQEEEADESQLPDLDEELFFSFMIFLY